MDAQTIVDTLAATDETTALTILTAVIQSKPELAAPMAAFLIPDLTYPPAVALTKRRSKGTIKSLNESKGFGFIDCAELHAEFGADVFVHQKQFAGLSVGQEVSFAVMMSKDNKPQAYDVCADDGQNTAYGKSGKGGGKGKGYGKGEYGKGEYGKGEYGKGEATDPFAAMMAMMLGGDGGGEGYGGEGYGYGKGEGKDDGKDGKSKKGPTKGKPNEVEVVGEFQGIIKSFNPKSGYGFIECPDLREVGCPNDVFLHHQQLNGFETGSHVQFTCYMNRNGQPQAKDLVATQGDAKMARLTY